MIFDKIRCALGRHHQRRNFGNWTNSPSGDGFDVSECRHCRTELTRRSGGRWRAIPAADRP